MLNLTNGCFRASADFGMFQRDYRSANLDSDVLRVGLAKKHKTKALGQWPPGHWGNVWKRRFHQFRRNRSSDLQSVFGIRRVPRSSVQLHLMCPRVPPTFPKIWDFSKNAYIATNIVGVVIFGIFRFLKSSMGPTRPCMKKFLWAEVPRGR